MHQTDIERGLSCVYIVNTLSRTDDQDTLVEIATYTQILAEDAANSS